MHVISKSSNMRIVSNFPKASNHFGLKMLKQKEVNGVFSPPSISYVLQTLQLAAVENTHQQLVDLFGDHASFDQLMETQTNCNNPTIKMANCFLVNKNVSLNEDYLAATRQLATVIHRNFADNVAIAEEGNQFIRQGTNGLIDNIIKPAMISMETVMILINTLYFKTVWADPFKKYMTKDEVFNKEYRVPMMKNKSDFLYYEDQHVQSVDMLYQDKNYSMVFVLPKSGVKVSECYDHLFGNMAFKWSDVDCEIPRFTQRKNINLKPLLQQMGLTDLFDSLIISYSFCVIDPF